LSRPVPPVWRDYTDFLLFASDIAMLLTVGAWLLRLRLLGKRPSLSPRFFSIALIALTVVAGLSIFTSVDPGLSMYHTLRLIALFAFFLFIASEVKNLAQLAPALAIQVAIQSVVALVQAGLQHSIGLLSLGEYALNPEWSGVSIVATATTRFLRAYGLSDHPNILGGCLAFALVLLFVHAATQKEVDSGYVVVFVLGSLALFFTFSRSAWLAAAAGLALGLWLIQLKLPREAFRRAFVILLMTAILFVPLLWQSRDLLGIRLGAGGSFEEIPSEIGSLGERAYLLDKGNQLFTDHAVLGTGVGTMPVAFLREFPNFSVSYQPAHFVILESAAEIGLLGVTFLLLLLAMPFAFLWQKRNMPFTPAFIAANAVLLAIVFIGFFDYYPWLLVPGRLWLWLGWGLWAGAFTKSFARA
jgi:O-antigen ligase